VRFFDFSPKPEHLSVLAGKIVELFPGENVSAEFYQEGDWFIFSSWCWVRRREIMRRTERKTGLFLGLA